MRLCWKGSEAPCASNATQRCPQTKADMSRLEASLHRHKKASGIVNTAAGVAGGSFLHLRLLLFFLLLLRFRFFLLATVRGRIPLLPGMPHPQQISLETTGMNLALKTTWMKSRVDSTMQPQSPDWPILSVIALGGSGDFRSRLHVA